MIPLSALGGGLGGGPLGLSGLGGGCMGGMTGPGLGIGATGPAGGGASSGMISLSSLGGGGLSKPTPGMMGLSGMQGLPPSMSPPSMAPPTMEPPLQPFMQEMPVPPASQAVPPRPEEPKPFDDDERCDILAEVGKTAKDYLDVLQPITIPKSEEDQRPVPRQVACLENGTDLFKMFDVDMHRFDPKAVRKTYHKMAALVHPDKLGREPTKADQARFTKLKQAYTVVMDEQLRAVYRQHCFGISGSGGCPALGHDAALSKSLELGRDLRKMGEERAIVLHKASETGWSVNLKDADGRGTRGDGRKIAHRFNLFGDISSSEDDDALLEKERRNMQIDQILLKSPKYADAFLEKAKAILLDTNVSRQAAGEAFTVHEEMKALEMLNENPKSVQSRLRKLRAATKQMNWAMTSLLQDKDSPWRGLEVKSSLVEHSIVKLLEMLRSGIAMGKFSEVHEDEFLKLLDNIHRLYMDLFEKRGQELLRAAISAELMVVHLLPESEGRLPEGTKVTLRDLASRADLNGKRGIITGWDYSLQRYTVELEKVEAKKDALPSNPELLQLEDFEDADEEEVEENQGALAMPKKLMLLPKNALVDLGPAKKTLENLVADWNAWRRRPRSVSATQDAEAVAAALGPPLENMANFLREACAGVSTAAACPDGFDLVADDCREALQQARILAAKLLGEEPQEPPPPPSMTEPPPALVALGPVDKEQQALREAAEVAAAGLKLKKPEDKKKKRSRSRSRSRRRRRRRDDSSSSSSSRRQKRRK
eukprot:TRINITY_DN26447_c0_g1_i1.p1 TRINITY_DN26447_c0_g1~~TRINITY_DN26447_c0_g1_i1.p1  ORF type:complete len:766 (-),score=189.39 TRINITY_DN26447_c0_g1_i1:107-2404(-)